MTLEEKLKSYGFRKASRVSAKKFSKPHPSAKADPISVYGLKDERIGVAYTKERGQDRRRDGYGIFRSPYGGLTAQYEGYRLPNGDQIGLASGGPGWRQQPKIEFKKSDFDLVRFFPEFEEPMKVRHFVHGVERKAKDVYR